MERNFRRPLDWSDGRKSLDSNPNRRCPLVPHLQKTGNLSRGGCQEVESQCFCPDGEQFRETHGNYAEEGGGGRRSCDFNAGYWGGKRDAERLLPTECKARRSVQGMGRRRSSLQAYCQYFHRSVCVCLHRQDLTDNTITNNWANICLTPGVRMLRQDPTECLFSFICTSNNHISRIQGMVERLCQALGTPLCQLDQTSYYNFPSLSALAGGQTCSFYPYLHLCFLYFKNGSICETITLIPLILSVLSPLLLVHQEVMLWIMDNAITILFSHNNLPPNIAVN